MQPFAADPDPLYRSVGDRLVDAMEVARLIRDDHPALDASALGRLSGIMVRALEETWFLLGFDHATVDDILLDRLKRHVDWRPLD